jgi:hypothetical protein
MNTHVRDNLNETAPAKGAGAGAIYVSEGSNSIVGRTLGDAEVATTESTASTSYTNLATTGPGTSRTTGTKALVLLGAAMRVNSADARVFMSIEVTGATAVSATDSLSINMTMPTASTFSEVGHHLFYSSLTAGVNTFTAKYRTTAGTADFARRRILVIPL